MTDQVKFTQKLKGTKVLVIGGSSGIGYGVAEGAVEQGAEVHISGSSPQRAEETVARLVASYPSAQSRIHGHACGLGDEASLEANVKALFESVGADITHIVHTAGDSLAMIPLGEIDVQQVKQAGMVRFFSPLIVAKYAPKYLSPGPRSSITLTTGTVSQRPIPGWSVVGSYATGLQGMCRGLALDLKPIRVNLVSPGLVDTELWRGFSEEQKQNFFKEHLPKIPVGKIGQVTDVAESFLYLMKDQNVSGTMITTDGGQLLC